MKDQTVLLKLCAFTLLTAALGSLVSGCASCGCGTKGETASAGDVSAELPGFLLRTNYHGWEDSIWMSNGKVEAIIVPAIGRVMQFRFAGEADGPFWENESLFGKTPDPKSGAWMNFGGDKTWPAPQSRWGDVAPTNWPPPVGFDATPAEARVEGWVVNLVWPVDASYGIRPRRQIELGIEQPTMTITTTYEKVSGKPLEASIWIVTQLKEPIVVYAPLAMASRYREGFSLLSDRRPAGLGIQHELLSLTRDPKTACKIGLDTSTLLWLGEREMLRVDSSRLVLQDYPDDGCSAQVYTSPNPLAYVEFEMLGPLKRMTVGDTVSRSSTYTLLRRTEVDPKLEARRLLQP